MTVEQTRSGTRGASAPESEEQMKYVTNAILVYTGLSLIGGGKTELAVLYGLLVVVATVMGFLNKTEYKDKEDT